MHRKVAQASPPADGPQKSGGAISSLLLLAALFAVLPFTFVAGAGPYFKAAIVTTAILVDLAILLKAPIVGSPAEQKTVAVTSIAMWVAVVFGGLWIAFV